MYYTTRHLQQLRKKAGSLAEEKESKKTSTVLVLHVAIICQSNCKNTHPHLCSCVQKEY